MSQPAQAEVEYLRIGGVRTRILRDLNTRHARNGVRRTRVVLVVGGRSSDYAVAHIPSEDPRSRETLRHMWSVLKDINHPGFPRFYQPLYDDEGFCGFLREYCPHHDPYWRNLFPELTLGTFLRLGTYLAFGAHRFHQSGHILGDITPWNVCFKPWSFGLRPCYMDFDTATKIGSICGISQDGGPTIILGTPAFISPEQIHGTSASPGTDQFGLAATLLSIATGSTGFSVPGDCNVRSTFTRAAQGSAGFPFWPFAEEILPEALCRAFEKALDPRYDNRFPDCLSFGHALKAGLRVLSKEELDRVLPPGRWDDETLQRRAITINPT